MKSLNRLKLTRIILNVIFVFFIIYTSIDNNRDTIPYYVIVIYNVLLFVPSWLNNYLLLPMFRKRKVFIKYILQLFVLFLVSVFVIGNYINRQYVKFLNDDLSEYTSFAVTSVAPKSLKSYQCYFDVYPGILLVLIVMTIGYVIQEYLQKIKNDQKIKTEQNIAELNLLKSQISPHFLFNVLNSLYALSLKSSKETPDVILKLSDILRYSLYESQQKQLLISDEIHVLKTYIEIEKIRIPVNASVYFNCENVNESVKIAPMLLLPIVENAFKHGVDSMIDESYVKINLYCNEKELIFKCENNYKPQIKNDFGGIGLENVRKRLKLLYPSNHFLEIINNKDTYSVSLKIKF